MLKGIAKYAVLYIFLFGVLLTVYLQFNSGQSINHLIQANASVLNELKLQSELQKLQTDIVALESNIRGAVITRSSLHLQNIEKEISTIESELNSIKSFSGEEKNAAHIKTLNELVETKIRFSHQIIDSFYTKGKSAAESLIITNRGKYLTDSLVAIIYSLNNMRKKSIMEITASIEENGKKARERGMILAIVAGLSCIAAFWHIITISRRQQKLIGVLNASEKKEKNSAKIKEQFMANMSHEIRTPMNAILGFTSLLQKTHLSADQQQFVKNIQSSGENLLSIVNDILDLSKIEAGMMRIEPVAFSLRGLLHSVEVMFQEKARRKQLSLEVKIEEQIPDGLYGDAIRLTQILVNLMENAVKFTQQGSVALYVKTIKKDTDNIRLQFCVKDTGIGIPANKLEHIFDRFQQAEAATTRRFGGTGLGLSIVKQLIEIQNGIIKVNSKVNHGSEFIAELTYALTDEKILETAYLPAGEKSAGIADFKILVAEDNIMNQQLITHLINRWQMNFKIVNNGREAIRVLENNRYDLVLMDIQMPDIDGYTATQIIRTELNLNVPIVAMTAHAMAGEKEKCLGYGMNDYISKPINEEELYRLIERFITASGNTRQLNGHALINQKYLKELSKGDIQFEQDMINQFILQVPEELQNMRKAIAEKDYEIIKAAAHGMKSSVSYLGLNETLSPHLEEIEKNTNSKNLESIQQEFKKLQSICEQAVEEARQIYIQVN